MELLVTVASLLVALYTVIPRERRMELSFRIGPIDWTALLIVSILMLYFEYYAFFVANGWALDPTQWPPGITPTSARPFLVLVLAGFLCWRVWFARLSRRRIAKFAELCWELKWRESYPELVALLARNIKEFFRIYRADYMLPALRGRLASRVFPTLEDTISRLDALQRTGIQPPLTLADRIPDQIVRRLIRFLPSIRPNKTLRPKWSRVF